MERILGNLKYTICFVHLTDENLYNDIEITPNEQNFAKVLEGLGFEPAL